MLALVGVLAYPGSARFIRRSWVTAAAGLLICWAAWIALVVIRDAPSGSHWIVWLLVLVGGADVGAFFAGRSFGHTKLAPAVSPGKTWEGLWGGMAMASVMCGVILLLMGRFNAGWLLIMVLLVVMSVFGDLFESVLKRVRGMKDSGTLLPGHGGRAGPDRLGSRRTALLCAHTDPGWIVGLDYRSGWLPGSVAVIADAGTPFDAHTGSGPPTARCFIMSPAQDRHAAQLRQAEPSRGLTPTPDDNEDL